MSLNTQNKNSSPMEVQINNSKRTLSDESIEQPNSKVRNIVDSSKCKPSTSAEGLAGPSLSPGGQDDPSVSAGGQNNPSISAEGQNNPSIFSEGHDCPSGVAEGLPGSSAPEKSGALSSPEAAPEDSSAPASSESAPEDSGAPASSEAASAVSGAFASLKATPAVPDAHASSGAAQAGSGVSFDGRLAPVRKSGDFSAHGRPPISAATPHSPASGGKPPKGPRPPTSEMRQKGIPIVNKGKVTLARSSGKKTTFKR